MGRLQTARLENFIRRWGSIKGGGSVLSESLGEVFPVLDLENLTPENFLPAGWTPWFGFVSVIGVAAQLTAAGVLNPANSGMIVVVERAIINKETDGIMTAGVSFSNMTVSVNVRSRDRRAPIFSGIPQIGVRPSAGAAETGLSLQVTAGEDYNLTLPHGLAILPPNTQFAIANATTNDDITISFSGRVRIAEPSELSF